MDVEAVVASVGPGEVLEEVSGSGSRDVKEGTLESNEGMEIDTEGSGEVNVGFTDETPSSGLVVAGDWSPETLEAKASRASLLCFMRRSEPSKTSDCAPETTKGSVDSQKNVRLHSKCILGIRRRGKGWTRTGGHWPC